MTDPIIDRLDQIKGRADKATEGPWAAWTDQDGQPHMNHMLMVGNAAAVIPEGDTWVEGVDINPIAHTYTPEDREFIAAAREDVPRMEAALRAVIDLHKPEARYLVWGYEEVSFSSVEDAAEFVGQPVEAEEFKLCAECKRVEDGAADNAAEIGYETSLWPCPTVRAMAEKWGEQP